jgi:5-methylcytosine-specific restriction endonuclease McrA
VTKRCPKCGETKPVEDFGKNRSMADGLQGWCKSCVNAAAKPYRKKNRAARTLYNKGWRATNPDKVAAYYAANKEELNQRSRDHYAANKARYKENYLRWITENKDRWTAYRNQWSRERGSGHRDRAKRYGVQYTPVNKTAIFERDNWICGICGDLVDKTIPWPDLECATLDHVVPMSLGGDHVESNVQIAHFFCNLLKRDSYEELSDEV